MEGKNYLAEKTVNGFVAAALVLCAASVGWAVAGMFINHVLAKIAAAAGLASCVIIGGIVNRRRRSGF